MAVSYQNYCIFARKAQNPRRPVAWIVARRVTKNANFCLCKERSGPWYLCVHAREHDELRKKAT